jgi:hypothetical protein
MATEQKVKAIKPDEEAFKASLVQAEKDLSTVQEKIVWLLWFFFFSPRLFSELDSTAFNPISHT